MNEISSLIALHQITGVGWHTIQKMFDAGWDLGRPLTPSLITELKHRRIPQPLLDRIKEKWTLSFIRQVEEELQRRKIQAITPWHEMYPSWLKEISQPPWILYLKGDSSLLSCYSLAMVGTRKPTPYGKKIARMLSEQLVEQEWTVVSGMASGIDGEAHRSVLESGGKTVAVLATGVDVIYPKSHRSLYQEIVQKGVVVSEMPPGTRPHPGLFPQRNRIISGLSLGTIVVEAAEKSGSLITADYSMEQGRDVFAVPGPISSKQSIGALKLIQQGAKCVVTAQDVFDEFIHIKPLLPVKDSSDSSHEENLTTQEQDVLNLIPLEPMLIDQLMEQLKEKMTLSEMHQALCLLEIKQKISQLPGAQVIRK
ncbi:DNA-processing protein DprA [Hazenella coriacea]|uniref:DNA processing protein n=1 Tax=Hazenella coriacea TaxID=1179467 RepID=A0A4R3L3F1_9BACL|nr:DNA-processing protein DprA [Hazenella coriacea]TCS93160.1 DNA processing protein [Hazenella coriacea]